MTLQGTFAVLRYAATVAMLCLSFAAVAQSGYRYAQTEAGDPTGAATAGPVRMARVSYVQGNVTWRPGESAEWSAASANIPLRQGAQVSVSPGAAAEVQFDDGSRLRLGSDSVATIQTLFSDSRSEFSEIQLNTGMVSLTTTNRNSSYQFDTPVAAIKTVGISKVRIGLGSELEVMVRRGEAQVNGSQGTSTVGQGEVLHAADTNSQFQINGQDETDSWDQFCDERDRSFDHPGYQIPSTIGLVSGDLSQYGQWRVDARYGHVWYPHVRYPDWRPYHDGHWIWVEPFGWTWVAEESWGWAPFHYGTWTHTTFGWGWCPGPKRQYWSPAVVSFSVYNSAIAWCPLAPSEVIYPPRFGVGLASGSFALSLSIGGATCYYPGGVGFCISRPWSNSTLNLSLNVYDPVRIAAIYGDRRFVSTTRFVPTYGHSSFAISRTTSAGFVGRGRFQSGTSSDVAIFQKGVGFASPVGRSPVFGPASVRPTREAFTPSRSFQSNSTASRALQGSVYRSSLPTAISKTSSRFGATIKPASRYANANRATGSRYARGTTSGSTSKYARPGTSKYANSGSSSRYSRPGTSRVTPGTSAPRGGNNSGSRYSNGGVTRPSVSHSTLPPHASTSHFSPPRGSPAQHGTSNSRSTPPNHGSNNDRRHGG